MNRTFLDSLHESLEKLHQVKTLLQGNQIEAMTQDQIREYGFLISDIELTIGSIKHLTASSQRQQ